MGRKERRGRWGGKMRRRRWGGKKGGEGGEEVSVYRERWGR